MSEFLRDPWNVWTTGFLIGCAWTYIMLYRPTIRFKNDYIARLENRLDKR